MLKFAYQGAKNGPIYRRCRMDIGPVSARVVVFTAYTRFEMTFMFCKCIVIIVYHVIFVNRYEMLDPCGQ